MSSRMPTAHRGTDRAGGVRALDVAGAVGLAAALAVVFALDRGGPVDPTAAPPVVPPPPPPRVDRPAPVPELPYLPFPAEAAVTAAVDPPPPLPPPPPIEAAPAAPAPPPAEDLSPKPIDPKRRVIVGFTNRNNYFGLTADTESGELDKPLTVNQFGETNHTAVSVDGAASPFFGPDGKVLQNLTVLGRDTETNKTKFGAGFAAEVGRISEDGPYVVQWGYRFVLFEQSIDYEANPVTRRVDTVRVRYTLTNTDRARAHTAGLRLMIDTKIGSNDGVPFFIPGRQGVIDKPLVLSKEEVPETVLALERNDLTDTQMTVAQFRFGASLEDRPGGLVLTQWPGDRRLAEWLHREKKDEQWRTVDGLGWTWPLAPTFGGDSAVGIYYTPKPLKPGESRSYSFAYGLGTLSPGGGASGLKLYSAGPFEAGKPFRLTAFVRHPKVGQTVALTLPQGLRLDQGERAEKPVEVQAGVEVTKVDWLVTPDRGTAGKVEVAAELSGTGRTERLPVYVANTDPAVRELVVTGTPVAGGRFRVTAQVLNARDGVTATLSVPDGLALDGQQPAAAAVPRGAVGQASWVLAADRAGDFAVGVRLSSGAEATRTVTVRPREPAVHKVVVSGSPSAGGLFRVTAQVLFPPAGASAELVLPPGLTLAPGEAAGKDLPAGAVAQPSWLVRADRGASGKLPVKVRLAAGGPEASETVTVAPPVRALTVRLAKDEPAVRGRPFWVVADVSNPAPKDAAEIKLPTGFKLAPGHERRKTLDGGGEFGRAAWPVVLDADVREAELSVAVAGVGGKSVRVTCREGTLVER